MADRDQHPSRDDETRHAVFDQVDLQTAELEIVGSIYDGFAAAIVVTGQPRTVALTREYGDAVQLMSLIERGRAPLFAIDLAGGAMPSKTFVKPASVGRSDGPIFAAFVDAVDAPAAPQEARPQVREEAQPGTGLTVHMVSAGGDIFRIKKWENHGLREGSHRLYTTPPAPEAEKLFQALRDHSWDLRCFDMPTGGDDFDIGWRVVGHWQAEPCERTIAEVFSDDPARAVREALAALQQDAPK